MRSRIWMVNNIPFVTWLGITKTCTNNGFFGGIWTFWNAATLNIQVVVIYDQIMVLLVLKEQRVERILIPFYASPYYAVRLRLWKYISELEKRSTYRGWWLGILTNLWRAMIKKEEEEWTVELRNCGKLLMTIIS